MAILPQVFTVPSFVTGASISSALEVPGSFLFQYLVVPTMSAGYSAQTPIYLQGSYDGNTFFRYTNPESNTITVGVNDFAIASSVSQRMVYLTNFAFRFVRIELSATATTPAAVTPFKFICVSNQ
jgi:hypothetical protein